jgi:hypothetical protein
MGRQVFMNTTANPSYCPRLSEARRLLPLLRDCLVRAAPRPLATAVDLLPILEDGLFGYELIPDRETHIFPIIGCNAQGEAVVRRNTYDVSAPAALHLAAVNGRFLSCARREGIQRRDARFHNWAAAAESAWEQILILCSDLPRDTPILQERAHRGLDKALCAAQAYLDRWDPFIEFLGLPDEAQLGLVLTGSGGERGELMFKQPDTWALRWNAPPVVVRESWSQEARDLEPGGDVRNDYRRSSDRRAQFRRASDRGRFPVSWAGKDRRKVHGRRAIDEHAT